MRCIFAIILVIALLVTSLPASARTSSHTYAAIRHQRSFLSQLYSDFSTTLAAFGSWVREVVRPKPAVSRPYVPVAAYLNPASARYVANNLVENVFKLLDNDGCRSFVSNLLNVARTLTGKKPITYDAYKLVRKVAFEQHSEAGLSVYPGIGGGSVGEDIFSGEAKVNVYLRPEPVNPVGVQIWW